ncbi:peptidase M55 [Candidatus Atribacteria bacterium HGW-Atribacteria-1]|nr:MAG: peptidase M55 [Candidatus Atribacteria bacterium HGW-Atribacteria-1]
MKIFISADIEGISGVVDMEQISPEARNYERACRLMTKEVNAVIEAAFEHGADEVVVSDSHHNNNNILIEELHPRATLISGSYQPLSMMQGIDNSFDAVFFVGYHARAGISEAVIDHTYTFRVVDVKINDNLMGEAGINGRVAGCFGVPVAFISGDQNAIMCAKEELNSPVGVVVKESISRTAAKIYPFPVVKERLTAGVSEAMKNVKLFKPTIEEDSVKLEVSFAISNMAEICLLIPGVTKKDGRTVIYVGKEYMEVFNVFRVMLGLTSGIK